MPKIGLKNFHYAVSETDGPLGCTYKAPVRVPGIMSAKVNPKSSSTTLYADDAASESASALGEIEIEIELKDLSLEDQVVLLGKTIKDGILWSKATDVAPYVAIAFESPLSGGRGNRYVWYSKGQFSLPDDESKTQEDKPVFQSAKIKGTFLCRDFDKVWKVEADTGMVGFEEATWYQSVPGSTQA